jgi:hypothetical protein
MRMRMEMMMRMKIEKAESIRRWSIREWIRSESGVQ